MQTFANYSDAKTAAERAVRDLANGSQAAALSNSQSRDALVAFERLQGFYQTSGRHVSLLSAVTEFIQASSKLNGRTLDEAIVGYLRTAVSVKEMDIGQCVEEFLKIEEQRTKVGDGHQAQLSTRYAYTRACQLRKFAATFPGIVLCDLSKEHVKKFIDSLGDFAPKTRNHYRAAIRQFLDWSIRKNYLPATHRLNEADGMRPERANNGETDFYTPDEFTTLLTAADDTMCPLIAIGGLAGLRTTELQRLHWKDVWRVAGHIEITASKAKTRQRRLVEMCPALAAWLEPFRDRTDGRIWDENENVFQKVFLKMCEGANIRRKANGLRHAFCTYHFALHANENLTAQQAGNSPAMIHAHYKGLATKVDSEKWFNVMPEMSAKNVR